MSRHAVQGRLISSSHLFYLSKDNRVFILKLQEVSSSGVSYVFCSLSPSLQACTKKMCKEILLMPPYQRVLTITKTKQVNVGRRDSNSQVFQLTKSSTIVVETDQFVCSKAPVLSPQLGMIEHKITSLISHASLDKYLGFIKYEGDILYVLPTQCRTMA